jgi:hypothetical protein
MKNLPFIINLILILTFNFNKESSNGGYLDMIERCIFVICLDKKVVDFTGQTTTKTTTTPTKTTIESLILPTETFTINDADSRLLNEMTPIAFQMIHGCGSNNNSGNRWFDKTIQFIITDDGTVGLNYEHSVAEGIAVIELCEHTFRYIEEKRKQKLYRMSSICELPMPTKLCWTINDKIKEWINEAKHKFDASINNLDFTLMKYSKFGRDFPKKAKCSPDCFVQLALQLAYFKLYNKLVSTYESASTRRFLKGRVDNIRANSCEALEWVKAMSPSSGATKEVKLQLFRDAVDYQTNLMVQVNTF